jgi:hypothetical protein
VKTIKDLVKTKEDLLETFVCVYFFLLFFISTTLCYEGVDKVSNVFVQYWWDLASYRGVYAC